MVRTAKSAPYLGNVGYKVYNDGFVNLIMGDSAAQSVILMVLVIALTAFQFRFIERRVHYG
jgi:sn-glycerol 3-phosphate transport system permease protein